MAIIKGLSSRATPQKIVDYLTKEEKTEEKLISGKDCNPENIVQEFRATKELYDKTEGVQYHHMIQSFSPKDNITPEKAHELGKELAEKQFKGHEVFVVTHKDKEHLHNHLVVNSVSFEDGKKYQSNRTSMIELKRESNRQCEREGLTTLDLEHRATERVTTGEKRIEMKGGTPWKDELRQCIDFSKERANNFEEFKNSLKKNFDIDTRITNKTISYQHPEKAKPIRGSKLGTNYDKEVLENEFIRKEKSITGRGANSSIRDEGNRDTKGFGFSWDKSETGTPTGRTDNNKQQNIESDGAKREGQTGSKPKSTSEREGETGNKGENKPNIQGLEKGSRGNEDHKLSENRGNDQEIERGTNGESSLSQQGDKEHIGISTSSKEHSKPELERESQTILPSTTSNSRNDSSSNRSISTCSLDDVLKELESSVEKVFHEEKLMAEKEARKLEKQMERPQIAKQKEDEWER